LDQQKIRLLLKALKHFLFERYVELKSYGDVGDVIDNNIARVLKILEKLLTDSGKRYLSKSQMACIRIEYHMPH